MIPYGKIFVVFDKDSFSDDEFNKAINMCNKNGFIPLWSNEAIEFWFLIHFNYIDVHLSRTSYAEKINESFKNCGFKYKYKKNDKEIYKKLNKYGSQDFAIKNARRRIIENCNNSPAKSYSCTKIYDFFDEIDERLQDLDIKLNK